MTASSSDVVLLACYELGHQPLSLAWPAAVLREAGLAPTTADLSVERLPVEAIASARFVGIAVPMHTAMRLGLQTASRVRAINPSAHVCFYGLYAYLNAEHLLEGAADSVLAGEMEDELLDLVQRVIDQPAKGSGLSAGQHATPALARLRLPVPDRTTLPPLSEYAHYMHNGRAYEAGYVETTRGCLHTCRHCPVVPVYGGRFFAIARETVMADIRQQVLAGARHITFGDPDFLNGPGHALAIARALHDEFPEITFDFTTKVEHILQHRDLMLEMGQLGTGFVISAFETIDDEILRRLEKGHTAADMDVALDIMAEAGIPIQPTWLPFTPWTTLEGYVQLLTWIRKRDLIQHTPAVQLSIRLLVPPPSALLDTPNSDRWLGPLDASNLAHSWQNPDPCVDELQKQVAAIAERGDEDPYLAFAAVEAAAYRMVGRPAPQWRRLTTPDLPPPRLTEDWFC